MSAKRGGSELSVIVPLEVEFIFWRPPLVRITFFYLDSHRKKNIFYSTLSNCLSNCTWWTAFGFNLSRSDRRHNMSLLLLKDNYELMSNLKIDWLLNSISGMSFFPNFILKTSSKENKKINPPNSYVSKKVHKKSITFIHYTLVHRVIEILI